LYVLSLSGFLLLAAAAATWFLVPPLQPSARADLLVEPAEPFVLAPIGTRRQSGDNFIKSQAMIIKNQGLVIVPALRPRAIKGEENPDGGEGADEAIGKDDKLKKPATEKPANKFMALSTLREVNDKGIDVYQWLEDKLQVEAVGTQIMRISLAGDHSKELEEIVKAITEQYLYFLEKDRNRNQEVLKTLRRANEGYLKLAEKLRAKLSDMSKGHFNFDNPENVMISFRIMMIEVEPVYAELVKAKSELRHLELELGLGMKGGDGWENFAAVMNSLPGPGLPMNHALVAALYGNSEVFPAIIRPNKNKKIDQKALHEAIEKDKDIIAQRQSDGTSSTAKKWERYEHLKALVRALEPEVKRLKDYSSSLHRGDPVAPSLQQEIAMYDKLIERTRNRIELLQVELKAPPRITWPGNHQVTIHTPYDRTYYRVKIAAMAAAAVGIALLVMAWRRFRNRSSAPSLPNTPS
jgi:hypothetical protein